MAEIDDHGQSLTLRTRRGADLRLDLELTHAETGFPMDLTGAAVLSRVFAPGQPTHAFDTSIAANIITLQLTAAATLGMQQDWNYTLGYRLNGATQPLLYGPLFVSQEQL